MWATVSLTLCKAATEKGDAVRLKPTVRAAGTLKTHQTRCRSSVTTHEQRPTMNVTFNVGDEERRPMNAVRGFLIL